LVQFIDHLVTDWKYTSFTFLHDDSPCILTGRSIRCFRLGWPMRADADFFCQTAEELRLDRSEVWVEETN